MHRAAPILYDPITIIARARTAIQGRIDSLGDASPPPKERMRDIPYEIEVGRGKPQHLQTPVGVDASGGTTHMTLNRLPIASAPSKRAIPASISAVWP